MKRSVITVICLLLQVGVVTARPGTEAASWPEALPGHMICSILRPTILGA